MKLAFGTTGLLGGPSRSDGQQVLHAPRAVAGTLAVFSAGEEPRGEMPARWRTYTGPRTQEPFHHEGRYTRTLPSSRFRSGLTLGGSRVVARAVVAWLCAVRLYAGVLRVVFGVGRGSDPLYHTVEAAQQAVRLQPRLVVAHIALAQALRGAGRLREALTAAREALGLHLLYTSG